MFFYRCYYEYNNEVIFVSHRVEKNGESLIAAFHCEKDLSRITGDSLTDNAYFPVGEPFIIAPEKLDEYKLLNRACLECRQCKRIEDTEPVDFLALSLQSSREGCDRGILLKCALHEKLSPAAFWDMTPNCEYAEIPIKFQPEGESEISDIKTIIRQTVSNKEKRFVETDYYTMPFDMFAKIKTMLDENDLVYFGTGESVVNGQRHSHESFDSYIEEQCPDYDTVCFKARNITKDVYEVLTSELSADILYYAMCIPSIGLVVYGDDAINPFIDGFAIFAPSKIIDVIGSKSG